MKDKKITICVVDSETKTVVGQLDKDVPDIFNIFDVCDLCFEKENCKNCIVKVLQMEEYTL